MPPSYEKQLLEKLVQQSEENNKILKSLRRHSRWSAFFSFIVWVIILVTLIWTYFYLQPHWDEIQKFTKDLIVQVQKINGFSSQVDKLINYPQDINKY